MRSCARAAGCGARGNWWKINTAATADWPQQQRLLAVMDNRDGTLSILATLIDQGGSVSVPPPTAADQGSTNFSQDQLAALARVFAFNDPRRPARALGGSRDRNLELIVKNPRSGRGAGLCAVATKRIGGKRLARLSLTAVLSYTV